MFSKTLNLNETFDPGNVYANRQVSEYLSNISSKEMVLSLYPNPATDLVFVEIPDDVYGDGRICVYDILGKPLLSKNIDSSIMKIDVSSFPTGLYKVVITGLNTFTGTLVVNR
jgi:hypothetical protein